MLGRLARPVVINENACEGCGTCYERFSCPAIGRRPDRVAFIIEDLCNGNGSCIQVCPMHAIVRPGKDDTDEDIARKYKKPGRELHPERCAEGK